VHIGFSVVAKGAVITTPCREADKTILENLVLKYLSLNLHASSKTGSTHPVCSIREEIAIHERTKVHRTPLSARHDVTSSSSFFLSEVAGALE
jgi:hypothetical protein